MNIIKLGHCCLLIKTNGITILTDPGFYTTAQNELAGIDVVLITHEHADHLHLESLQKVLANNPEARVITNTSVAKLLEAENISAEIVDHDATTEYKGVKIRAVGNEHAVIYPGIPLPQNTGYFIDNYLFYPGDALTDPKADIAVLAFPIAGPWLKVSEAIDYVIHLKPKRCFPVHDGGVNTTPYYNTATKVLPGEGIEFIPLEIGKETSL